MVQHNEEMKKNGIDVNTRFAESFGAQSPVKSQLEILAGDNTGIYMYLFLLSLCGITVGLYVIAKNKIEGMIDRKYLSTKTLVELKAITKERGFRGYSRMRKADLLEALYVF